MTDLWDKITRDDLDGDMQDVADIVGIEKAKKLMEMFSGDTLYFPKIESVIRAIRDSRIYQDFDGYNLRDLSRTHNLSTRQLRVIIQEQRKKKPKSGQKELDLFEK